MYGRSSKVIEARLRRDAYGDWEHIWQIKETKTYINGRIQMVAIR